MPDILIVEDNPVNQKLIAFLLARADYSYEVAENGQVALELLRKASFRLVLMDMMMPVMNGFDATRAIRSDPALAKLPIIALTANALKGEDDKCRAAGCNDYIAKPYSKEQVLTAIRRQLQLQLSPEPSATRKAAKAKPPVLD